MIREYPYLKDKEFLKELDKAQEREQFVKITVLTLDEVPIQDIEGRVVSSSLNIDGNSAIRRTCNLSLVASEDENDLTDIDNLLSLNKKIQLEVGFTNKTQKYKDYPIFWFPQGIFVQNSPTISHSTSGIEISLSMKDKMCLLNGECGGVFPAATTLHEYEVLDENGNYIITKPTIYRIIQELVNHIGGESLDKIIISDIKPRIKKVMKWTGNTPLYYYTDGLVTVEYDPSKEIEKVYYQNNDVGYIYDDFTYPGELIANAGGNVCEILDKIKNTLGNYEYFYDVYGNFIFREKRNYLNTRQSTSELDKLKKEDYLIDFGGGKAVYDFDEGSLITSYSNSPQFNMVKNDFVIWGIKETATGAKLPIRYHLAIDKKPKIGNTYYVYFYEDEVDKITKAKYVLLFNSKEDFPRVGIIGTFYGIKDADGNVNIYTWSKVEKTSQSTVDGKTYKYYAYEYVLLEGVNLTEIVTKDWRTELYLNGAVAEPLGKASNYYYAELANEWPKLYNVEKGEFRKEVIDFPTDIDFYLDFIDASSSLSKLSVDNIGRRTKVINDNSINCLFEPDVKDVVFIEKDTIESGAIRKECETNGQPYTQVESNIYSMLAIGGHFNSAFDLVKDLLYQYTNYNESITISSIPIFYLEPNSIITVTDSQSGIKGNYFVNSISLPLDISGTMSLSCTRVLERI